MHLNEEQIQRWLHGELDESLKDALAGHVAGCVPCAQRLEAAKREEGAIFDLLRHVDHDAPTVRAEAVVARGRGVSAVWARRAAGLVVAAALAGAAYALPGSPVPEWIHSAAAWITGRTEPPTPPPVDAPAPSQPVTAGIAVPWQDPFVIQFTAEQTGGVVAVSRVDGPNVTVRVINGHATFTTDAGRLTIDNRDSAADYEVEIPNDAPRVEVMVGARRLLLKDGDRYLADSPVDSTGRYVLRLDTTNP